MSRCLKLRGFLLLSAVVAMLVSSGVAEAQGQQLPAPEELINRHIEAIGGREAIQGHSSVVATGIVEVLGQGIVGEMVIHAAAPDKRLINLSFPAAGLENRTGYDGEVGWSMDSMMGERVLSGGELLQLVDESDYYADLHDPDRYSSMETLELVEFGGRPAYKLELVYTSGRVVIEYFDVESGRISGVEGVQESIMGPMNVVTTTSDYQAFGDLMVPTLMVQELGPLQKVQITIQTMEFDAVDPSVFELPPTIQALIR